jgi:hypothetical protein
VKFAGHEESVLPCPVSCPALPCYFTGQGKNKNLALPCTRAGQQGRTGQVCPALWTSLDQISKCTTTNNNKRKLLTIVFFLFVSFLFSIFGCVGC